MQWDLKKRCVQEDLVTDDLVSDDFRYRRENFWPFFFFFDIFLLHQIASQPTNLATGEGLNARFFVGSKVFQYLSFCN